MGGGLIAEPVVLQEDWWSFRETDKSKDTERETKGQRLR